LNACVCAAAMCTGLQEGQRQLMRLLFPLAVLLVVAACDTVRPASTPPSYGEFRSGGPA
jgi:hypothetical protein